MDKFNPQISMDAEDDDDQGEWREILEKWDEQEAAASQGLPTIHTLAMEGYPNLLLPNPHNHPLLLSDQRLITPLQYTTSSHFFSTSDQPLISRDDVSTAAISTSHADNPTTIAHQQAQAPEVNYPLDHSKMPGFVQSLQSQPSWSISSMAPSSRLTSSSSYSYNPLIEGDQQNLMGSTLYQASMASLSTTSALMQKISDYPSDYYSLAHESQQLISSGPIIRPRVIRDQYKATSDQSPLLSTCTPTSSASSEGPEDDSSSQERDQAQQHADLLVTPTDDLISGAGDPQLMAASSDKGKQELKEDPTPNPEEKRRESKAARATKKPKRERGTKFAIKMESDVEIVDDGYKWRKYGQKPVKNSPYPRSYYKCTDKQCKVKKHVERQAEESSYVVTTYEGVHNHPRPDQHLQVLHRRFNLSPHHQEAFPYMSTLPTTHNISPMEFLLRPSFFQPRPPPTNYPQHLLPNPHQTSETETSVDQGLLEDVVHGEPKRSSI